MGVLDDLLKKTKEAARKNAKTRAAGKKKKKKASAEKKQTEQKKSFTQTRNIDRVRGSRKTTSAPSSKPEEEKKRDASAAWDKFGRSPEGGGLRESMRPVEEEKRNVDPVTLQGNTGRTREELERVATQRELERNPIDDGRPARLPDPRRVNTNVKNLTYMPEARYASGGSGRTKEELDRRDSMNELARMTPEEWLKIQMDAAEERNKGKGVGPMAVPDPAIDKEFNFTNDGMRSEMAKNANAIIANWQYIPEDQQVQYATYLLQAYGVNDKTRDIVMGTFRSASAKDKLDMLEEAVYILGGGNSYVREMMDIVESDPMLPQGMQEKHYDDTHETISIRNEDGTYRDVEVYDAWAPQRETADRIAQKKEINDYRTYQEQQHLIDQYIDSGHYSRSDALKAQMASGVQSWLWDMYDAGAFWVTGQLQNGQEGIEFTKPGDNIKTLRDEGIGAFLVGTVSNRLRDIYNFIGIPAALFSKAVLSPEDVNFIERQLFSVGGKWRDEIARQDMIYQSSDLDPASKFMTEAIRGTVEMVPGIVASVVATPAAGLAVFGAKAGGASARDAYEQGATLDEAVQYGLTVGTAEVVTEKLFMGFGFMGKGIIAPTLRKVIPEERILTGTTRRILEESGFMNSTPFRIIKGVAASGGEATEEMIMEIVSPYIERTTYNPEAMDATFKEVLYAGGLGAVIGGILGIPVMISNVSNEANRKKEFDELIDDFRKQKYAEIDEAVATGEMTPEQASMMKAEAEDILAGKGSLNVSSAVPEEKVAGEALDTVYDTYEDAKKAMMQEARTKKDGEEISAKYIDNGVVKTFTTTAKGGTLGLGRSTEAGKEYQRIAQAKNVTERSGYQLNVKEEIIKEVSSLSKAIGREVEFYRNDDATDHGYMDKKTGKIYINAGSSQSAARSVIAHELTHQMESTAGWSKLVELMKKHYGSSYESRRQERIDAYEAFGKPLKVDETRKTYDEADQELVAMFVEEKLLTDADTIREVVNTDKTLAQKIIAWINKVIQKLAGSKEQKMLVEARDLWNQALQEEQSGKVKPRTIEEEVTDDAGVEVRSSIGKDNQLMNRAETRNKTTKAVSKEDLDIAREARETIKEEFQHLFIADAMSQKGKSPLVGNDSYAGSLDNTTICSRSLTLESIVELVAEKFGRPLTNSEAIVVAQELMEYTGDRAECLYCYQANAKRGYEDALYNFVEQRRAVIDRHRNGMDEDTNYKLMMEYDFEKDKWTKKDTPSARERFETFIKIADNKIPMAPALLMANTRTLYAEIENSKNSKNIVEQLKQARTYAQGAVKAHGRVYYAVYNGQILRVKQGKIEDWNRTYGLRMYSFSDFSPAFILENMQMVTDAAVRGLRMLSYTKEPEFVSIFGDTGMAINISVAGVPDGKGGYHSDGMQGMDWEQAKTLRILYPTAGTVYVAKNDAEVEWAMEQDWIDTVIPFHISYGSGMMQRTMGWTNYSGQQSEKKEEGWTKDDKVTIYPSEHQNDRETYLRLCEENHLTPKFPKWQEHPNYMKLVNETRLAPQEMNPVQPKFNAEAARATLRQFAKSGGYNPILGGTEENRAYIAEDIAQKVKKRSPEVEARDMRYSISRPLKESDLQEYLQAGKRRNKNKQEALVRGEKIILTTDEEIRDYIDSAIHGNVDLPTVAYAKVNKELADAVKNENQNFDIEDFYIELVSAHLLHAYKNHKKAKMEGDIDLTDYDFLDIPNLIENFNEVVDAVKFRSGKSEVILSSAVEQGKVILVETVSASRNSLQFMNMWGVTESKYNAEYKNSSVANSGGNQQGSIISPRFTNTTVDLSIADVSEKSNTRNSIGATKDAEYMDAVESGDMGTAQRLVREAANIAGFTSPKLHHGTPGFGFTQLRTADLEGFDWSPFFATPDPNLAETYSGETERRQLRGGYPKATQDQIDEHLAEYYGVLKKRIRAIDKHLSKPALPRANAAKRRSLMKDARNELANMVEAQDAKTLSEAYNRYIDAVDALEKTAMLPAEEALFEFDEVHKARWEIGRIIGAEEVFITSKGKLVTDENKEELERRGIDISAISDDEFLDYVKKYIDNDYEILGEEALKKLRTDSYRELLKTADKLSEVVFQKSQFKKDIEKAVKLLRDMTSAKSAKELEEMYNEYTTTVDMMRDNDKEFAFDDSVFDQFIPIVISEQPLNAYLRLQRFGYTDLVFYKDEGIFYRYLTPQEASAELATPGIYSFYANLDGMLEIDGEGRNWNHIDGSKIGKEGYAKTRDVALYARDNGYKGVIIKNIYDSGGQTDYYEPGDIYIFFEPASQVKSADTVTYDDNNEVIPLSERFNEENNDIRWSVGKAETARNYFVGDTVSYLNERASIVERYNPKGGTLTYTLELDNGDRIEVTADELQVGVTPELHFDELPEEEQEAWREPPDDWDMSRQIEDVYAEPITVSEFLELLYENGITVSKRTMNTWFRNHGFYEKRKKKNEKDRLSEKGQKSGMFKKEGKDIMITEEGQKYFLQTFLHADKETVDDMLESGKIKLPTAKTDKKSPLEERAYVDMANEYEDEIFDTGIDYWWATLLTSKGVTYSKDYARNFDAAAQNNPEARKYLQKYFVRPLENAKANYASDVRDKLESIKAKMAELGIQMDTEKASAVQWIGEGQYQDKYGELHKYTLENLKEEFPDDWENIKKAEEFFREMYDQYLKDINQAREKIYPHPLEDAQDKMAAYEARRDRAAERIADQRAIIADIEKVLVAKKAEILKKKRTDTKVYANLQNSIRYNEDRLARAKENLDDYVDRKNKYDVLAKEIKAAIDSGDILRNKRIIPRKDYFHHFQELTMGLGDVFSMSSNTSEIDPRLEGTSGYTEPRSKFSGVTLHRKHGRYKADAIEGMVRYVQTGEYMIHIDPVISEFRNHIVGMAKATKDSRNANKLIRWLVQWTNDLAGKTNPADRFVQDVIGRETMKKIKWINSRAKANAVVGNLSSASAQFFNFPNLQAYVNDPKAYTAGLRDLFRFIRRDKDTRLLMRQSGFLNERYLDDAINALETKTKDKISHAAQWTLVVGDRYTSAMVWFTAYNDAVNKGKKRPIEYADNITRRCVAGRGIGEIPLAQKSNITQIFAPFQIEVNNAYQLYKEKIVGAATGRTEKDKLVSAGQFGMILVVNFLMNTVTDLLLHRRVVYDPIYVFLQCLSDWKNGDDDEEEKNIAEKFAELLGRQAGEIISNIPYGSLLAYYGINSSWVRENIFGDQDPTRFGVSNIALDWAAGFAESLFTGKDIVDDVLSFGTTFLMPLGGKQTERTLQGLIDSGILPELKIGWKEGISFGWKKAPGSYDKNGQLQFPLKSPISYDEDGKLQFGFDSVGDFGEWLSLLAFGKYATDEGQKYLGKDYESSTLLQNIFGFNKTKERTTLSERATEVVVTLAKNGSDVFEVYDTVRELQDAENIFEKRNILAEADLTDAEKAKILLGYVVSEDNYESTLAKMNGVISVGLGVDDYLKIANLYSLVNDSEEYQTATEKTLLFNTELASMGYTSEQIQGVNEVMAYFSHIPADTSKFDELIGLGLSTDTTLAIQKTLGELEPLEGETQVSSLQKAEAIAGMGLSKDEETAAMAIALDDNTYVKYKVVTDYGVDAQTWVDLQNALEEANANNPDELKRNKSYDKEEKKAALDSLDVSNETRAALWQILDNQLYSTDPKHNTAWKAGRNPYSSSVGAQVVEACIEGKSALAASKETDETESAYTSPVSGDIVINSEYGYRIHPISGEWKMHHGLDIDGEQGDPVFAAAEGTVVKAVHSDTGYGNHVIIEHADGTQTLYAHMYSYGVEVGQTVSQGEQIGEVGSTGGTTGPHLHFEVRVDGQDVNPQTIFDFTGEGIIAESDPNYTPIVSGGGSSGGGSSGGSSRSGSTASVGSRTSEVASNRRSGGLTLPSVGGSGGNGGGSRTSTPVAGMSTSSPTYGTRGLYLPKASDYTPNRRSISSSVATTQRTGRTGGSFWDDNILS